MKDISNREIIKRLKEYFLENDPEIVAHLLASSMIDFNRLLHPEQMTPNEMECLWKRMKLNNDQLINFVENGPTHKLTFERMNSD
jgi:hypothetical protein